MKRHKMVNLDLETYEMALKIPNFSQWVRDKLRQERNNRTKTWKYCPSCDSSMLTSNKMCSNKMCDDYLFRELEELEEMEYDAE